MITENLGKIAITPKGQWVAGSYERLDLVTNAGSSYLSLKDENSSILTVTADWMLVAEKGVAGSTTVNLCLYKNGANGITNPSLWKWTTNLQVQSVLVMDNATNVTIQIGANTYDKTSFIGVVIPANTSVSIIDISIQAGYDNGNAIIIFTQG